MQKNIIIFGSSGLIGRNLSNYLEKKKHKVFRVDIKKNHKDKNFFKCDITKELSVKKTLSKIIKKNNIHVIFNAAAANPKVQKIKEFKFSNYSLKNWKKNLDIDLVGAFNTSKYIMKHYETLNSGKIINISSVYGLVGPDQDIYYNKRKKFYGKKPIEYSVSKAGIIGFSKALAAFYKNSNIEVFSLVLGGIEENQDKKFKKKYSSKTIIGRMIKNGEYNSIINFLVSNKTPFLTGSCLDLSAGALSIL
jgi:NAD(P)-dependent dehydrogenase (short-subunit alcohol dehydrogenase family)